MKQPLIICMIFFTFLYQIGYQMQWLKYKFIQIFNYCNVLLMSCLW